MGGENKSSLVPIPPKKIKKKTEEINTCEGGAGGDVQLVRRKMEMENQLPPSSQFFVFPSQSPWFTFDSIGRRKSLAIAD